MLTMDRCVFQFRYAFVVSLWILNLSKHTGTSHFAHVHVWMPCKMQMIPNSSDMTDSDVKDTGLHDGQQSGDL